MIQETSAAETTTLLYVRSVLEFIGDFAWPATALTIALIFRAQLRELAGRLVSGEIPGGKFTFSEQASRIEVRAERVAAAAEIESEVHEQLQVVQRTIGALEEKIEAAGPSGVAPELTEALHARTAEADALRLKADRLREQLAERREAFLSVVEEWEAELARSGDRVAALESAPRLAQRYAQELTALRPEYAAAQYELDERKAAWLRDRQDAETKLQYYRDRASELLEQVRQIREAGAEGRCPTCERALGKDFERVLGELEEQWSMAVQDGMWWKGRREQLATPPAEVAALEQRVRKLESALHSKALVQSRAEARTQELSSLREERDTRRRRIADLSAELDRLQAQEEE